MSAEVKPEWIGLQPQRGWQKLVVESLQFVAGEMGHNPGIADVVMRVSDMNPDDRKVLLFGFVEIDLEKAVIHGPAGVEPEIRLLPPLNRFGGDWAWDGRGSIIPEQIARFLEEIYRAFFERADRQGSAGVFYANEVTMESVLAERDLADEVVRLASELVNTITREAKAVAGATTGAILLDQAMLVRAISEYELAKRS